MSIDRHIGTCSKCGERKDVELYNGQWMCKRDVQWQEDLLASQGTKEAMDNFLKLFR